MKRVLLLAFLLPFAAIAQSLVTSVHGGIAYYSAADVVDPFGSIRVAANKNRFQFGGGLDFSFGKERRQYKYSMNGLDTIYKFEHATYGISPNIFANYRLPLRKSYLYAGVDAGLYYYPVTSYKMVLFPLEDDYLPMRYIKYKLNTVVGVQAGFSFYLSKDFDLNLEAAARYVPVPGKDILYFPLSAGFRYKPAKRIKKTTGEEPSKEIK